MNGVISQGITDELLIAAARFLTASRERCHAEKRLLTPNPPASPREISDISGFVLVASCEGRDILTTDEYPFDVEGEWKNAKTLEPGQQLLTHDGRKVTIESVEKTDEVVQVYNFKVADFHTYFVGSPDWGFDVWVHNSKPCNSADAAFQDAQKAMRDADKSLDPHDLEFYGGDGVVYVVPGVGTPSGLPYVGSTDDLIARAKGAADGRDRTLAVQIGAYPIGDRTARRLAEQNAINDFGGIGFLDNLRNEIK